MISQRYDLEVLSTFLYIKVDFIAISETKLDSSFPTDTLPNTNHGNPKSQITRVVISTVS